MNPRRLIGRLLAMFAIVGLLAAPLVTPVAAKRLAIAEMTGMSAMSGDMPCCPDGPKSKDCPDCPLVAGCMLTLAQAEPPRVNGIPAPLPTRSHFLAFDDLVADGLIGPPPDHPPRTSV